MEIKSEIERIAELCAAHIMHHLSAEHTVRNYDFARQTFDIKRALMGPLTSEIGMLLKRQNEEENAKLKADLEILNKRLNELADRSMKAMGFQPAEGGKENEE